MGRYLVTTALSATGLERVMVEHNVRITSRPSFTGRDEVGRTRFEVELDFGGGNDYMAKANLLASLEGVDDVVPVPDAEV